MLPLISRHDYDHDWVVTENTRLTVAEVLFRARALSRQLPDQPNCILLCEQRVDFIIGFLAALWREQTVLLPPDRSAEVVQTLKIDYPDSYSLTDTTENPRDSSVFIYNYAEAAKGRCTDIPFLDSSHLACRVFTSGSTGKPVAHAKYWGDLVSTTALLCTRYGFNENSYFVATVPPQHMYGLETTVLVPMMCPASVYGGMPFFAEDIRRVLVNARIPATLVTTPLHLRVCARAGLDWPQINMVISATAALGRQDAEITEQQFATDLREIYGSTESGAIASRHTVAGQSWTLYDGVQLKVDGQQVRVIAAHLPHRPVLADSIEVIDDTHFLMHGRTSDMIKIAGKRASLADLNLKLNEITGVEDGVIMSSDILPDKRREEVSRLCAVVVAPELGVEDVKKALAQKIDPVFLPRPLFKVDTLPRNDAGKLPHTEIKKLFRDLSRQ